MADLITELAMMVTREVEEKITEEVTRDVTREVTQAVTQEVTREVTEKVTQKVTREVSYKWGVEVAQAMLLDNEPVAKIIKYTRLDEDTVNDLRQKLLSNM